MLKRRIKLHKKTEGIFYLIPTISIRSTSLGRSQMITYTFLFMQYRFYIKYTRLFLRESRE